MPSNNLRVELTIARTSGVILYDLEISSSNDVNANVGNIYEYVRASHELLQLKPLVVRIIANDRI